MEEVVQNSFQNRTINTFLSVIGMWVTGLPCILCASCVGAEELGFSAHYSAVTISSLITVQLCVQADNCSSNYMMYEMQNSWSFRLKRCCVQRWQWIFLLEDSWVQQVPIIHWCFCTWILCCVHNWQKEM